MILFSLVDSKPSQHFSKKIDNIINKCKDRIDISWR